jgi:nitrate reductase gamma subunit
VAFEVFGAVGGITQGIARLLGLSKTARLRRTMNEYIKLYATLEDHDELKSAAVEVAGCIELYARQLALRELQAASRTYDWGYLGSAIFAAAFFAAPLPFVVPPQEWWHWLLAILSGGIAVLIVGIGVSSFRKQPKFEDILAASSAPAAEPNSLVQPQPDQSDDAASRQSMGNEG